MKKLTTAWPGTVLALGLLAATSARSEVVLNEFVDFSGVEFFVPCANGGSGEDVVFEGRLHTLIAVTLDPNGGFHLKSHHQPQGLQGIGLVTGDRYQATGVTQDHFNGRVGETYTYVNNFRLIGRGSGSNHLVHEFYHVTVLANGEVAVVREALRIECR